MEIACSACKMVLQVEDGRIKIPVHVRANGDPCHMSGREHTVTKPTARDPARIRQRTETQMAKDAEARKSRPAPQKVVDYGRAKRRNDEDHPNN